MKKGGGAVGFAAAIGVGIIGWGFMGRMHAYGVVNMPLFYSGLPFRPVLRGICSGHMENAREAAESMGVGFATDSYAELLSRPDIDCVCLCAPNALHEEMLLAAFRAGKHVYVEKPLTTSAASARRITEAYEAAGGQARLRCQVVFNNRFYPAVMRARELVEQGRVGDVLSFRCAYLHAGSVEPERPAGWKQDADAAGGVLQDLGSHALDLVRYLCGDFDSVSCQTRTVYPSRPKRGGGVMERPAEDWAGMLLTLQSGARGFVEASKIATGVNDSLKIEVHGTRGAVCFDTQQPNLLRFYDNTLPESPLGGERGFTEIESIGRYPAPGGAFPASKNALGFTRAHAHSLYSFMDCVYNERACSPSVYDGAYIQRAVDAAARSACEGRSVHVR